MKTLSILIFAAIFIFSTGVIAESNPMLEDIRQVYVTIDHAGLEPNEPPIDWTNLSAQVMDRCNKAGIELVGMVAGDIRRLSELRVTSKMLAVPDTEQFVFHIETSLYRFVFIADKSNVQISAPVWTSTTIMQSSEAEDCNEAITKAAMRQTDEFIAAWKAAQIKTSAEPNDNKNSVRQSPAIKPKNQSPAVAASPSQGKYIASKNSKVFHKADCSTAKTISAENLVTFASKDEALSSGRRPCKKCNP